jgi:hypothetical protein
MQVSHRMNPTVDPWRNCCCYPAFFFSILFFAISEDLATFYAKCIILPCRQPLLLGVRWVTTIPVVVDLMTDLLTTI